MHGSPIILKIILLLKYINGVLSEIKILFMIAFIFMKHAMLNSEPTINYYNNALKKLY